jgi:hypothetical protein
MEITRENLLRWAERYDEKATPEDKAVEKEMKDKLKTQRFLTRDDLVKIGLWKSRRPKKWYESNEDEVVQELTKFSFAAMTEWARIRALCALSGVSFPVASVILHFAFPENYPILDFRALASLGESQPKSYTLKMWLAYCDRVRGIAKDLGLPLRTVDKALWQFSKEKNEPPTSHY